MNQAVRIGGGPLLVQVRSFPPITVAQWIGAGAESARETAVEAVAELLSRPGERLVLDLQRLESVADEVLHPLARLISESLRVGRAVCLVRCAEELFRRLQRAGVSSSVTHAASLPAATEGLAGASVATLEINLRSTPELLRHLRRVIAALATQGGLSRGAEADLKLAVTEAAANAMVHGSPHGSRNQVRVAFHLEDRLMIVDVADQGPGFEPAEVRPAEIAELREHGYGLHMIRQLVDRVEFYRDERGMLVRMTKYLDEGRGEYSQ